MMVATPLVEQMHSDLRDLRDIRADSKRWRANRARYETKIDTMSVALGQILGYDCIGLYKAAYVARETPEKFMAVFLEELAVVERRDPVPIHRLVRELGLALAHAYAEEINVWKVQQRTHEEERHTCEIEIWCQVLDNQLRCGLSQVRRYAERAMGQTRPGANFWAEWDALMAHMLELGPPVGTMFG